MRVIDCYVETFGFNSNDIKWINIKAETQYKCRDKD